jgi:hypothetical protein
MRSHVDRLEVVDGGVDRVGARLEASFGLVVAHRAEPD